MPAGELAAIAGVSPQSASAHLQKLVDANVLSVWAQGRFRYYRIADDDVAALIESLVDLAAKTDGAGAQAQRSVADELRQSRSCYCHLAGQLGVLLSDALMRRKLVAVERPRRAGHAKRASPGAKPNRSISIRRARRISGSATTGPSACRISPARFPMRS